MIYDNQGLNLTNTTKPDNSTEGNSTTNATDTNSTAPSDVDDLPAEPTTQNDTDVEQPKMRRNLAVPPGEDDVHTLGNVTLGGTFLRAFMIILDFESKRIGFANKIDNYRSEILGDEAPGPKRPKN